MPFSEDTKLRVRRRSHFSCCLCKAIGVEIHHVIPQEEGGADAEGNAAPLCPSCDEIHGGNPVKRKFTGEARDLWYEICDRRYASDSDRIDELKKLLKAAVTYEDFQQFKQEIVSVLSPQLQTPRVEREILDALDRLWDTIDTLS